MPANAALPRNRKTPARPAAPPRERKKAAADDSRNLVNSLSKGLRVLEAFTAEQPEMTLSEVARARCSRASPAC